MKKLILALSFACLHAPIFAMQKALPVSPLQQELEQELRYPVNRAETETHIVFIAPLKAEFYLNVYAAFEKATKTTRVSSG